MQNRLGMLSPPALRSWVAVSLCCLGARAELLVVTAPGAQPAIEHAEVAFAVGEARGVGWVSLRVRRGPVAIVAALPEAASGEPGLDAWLAALERTASPHVLLPGGATDCGRSPSSVHVTWPRSPGVGAEELSLSTPEDVRATLRMHGLEESLQLPEAPRYLVWAWGAVDRDVTTRTLRISGASMRLSFVPASDWPVLISGLSPEPLTWPRERGVEELGAAFFAGKPHTDYGERLRAWLSREPGPFVESRATGPIFGWSILADAVSVPPLVQSYARAALGERDDVDEERCVEGLRGLRSGAGPSVSACGGATDAALALATAGSHPVLQRWATSGATVVDAASLREGGEPRAALVRARSLDQSACPDAVISPPSSLPVFPSGGSGTTGPGGSTAGEDEEQVAVEPHRDESCSSSPGNDPHYHEQSQTTVYCSGDSSSASGDDSCSSDSSSASGDDSCSSDSSSASGDDDSCSGGSEGGYDGETCTGRAAPDAEPTAARSSLNRAPGDRPRRLRLSSWSLALAAVLLPIRRRKSAAAR